MDHHHQHHHCCCCCHYYDNDDDNDADHDDDDDYEDSIKNELHSFIHFSFNVYVYLYLDFFGNINNVDDDAI